MPTIAIRPETDQAGLVNVANPIHFYPKSCSTGMKYEQEGQVENFQKKSSKGDQS